MRPLPILLASVALALSACGGDSNSEEKQMSTPPTATTKAAPPKADTTASEPKASRPRRERATGSKRTRTNTVRPNRSHQRQLRGGRSERALEDSGVIP